MKKVLLSDKFNNSLVRQACDEGQINMKIKELIFNRVYKDAPYVQEALSLLVLFDEILLLEEKKSDYGYSFPALEEKGIIKRVAVNVPLQHSFKKESLLIVQYGKHENFLEQLEHAVLFRPIILNQLNGIDNKKFNEELKLYTNDDLNSKISLFNCVIDYALAFYHNDLEAMNKIYASKILEKKKMEQLKEMLSTEFALGPKLKNIFEIILITAAHVSGFIYTLKNISEKYESPVATAVYQYGEIGWQSEIEPQDYPMELAKGFSMFRHALHEEGLYFPKINSIEHALNLRKDPNLGAFKKQLMDFILSITQGDVEAAKELKNEVQKAHQKLKKICKLESAINWATYFSLPVTMIEPFLYGIPALGISLSAFNAISVFAVKESKKKNKWVLFGRGK